MRIRSAAIAGLWLFAAACGGTEESTSTARSEEPSMGGGEQTVATGTSTQMGGAQAGVSTGARTPTRDTSMGAGASGTGVGASVAGTGVSGELGGSGSLAQGGAGGSAGATGRDLGAPAGMRGSETEGEMGMEMEEGMQPREEGTVARRPEHRGMEGEELAQGAQNEVCPADLEGLTVQVTQIPRGGALVFTASRDEVDELRDRLHRLANIHHQRRGHMGTQGSMEGSMQQVRPSGGGATQRAEGEQVGTQGEHMGSREEHARFADEQALIHQASEIRVIEIPRGARLEVRFDDATKVRDLRSELRETAGMLRNGQCPLSFQVESES